MKTLEDLNHPMQPITLDEHGVAQFKANAIVRYLLDNGGIDLNRIATLPFSEEDRIQFHQLIGWSVSEFGDLGSGSAAWEAAIDEADAIVEDLFSPEEEIASTRATVQITPALAAEWLLWPRGPHTRPPIEAFIQRLASHMAAGKWIATPNPIVFGADGSLLDGVQRLSAIVRSGVTITSEVEGGSTDDQG